MKLSRQTLIAASLAPLAVFGVLAVVLWQGLQHDPATLPSVLIGKPAPAFDLGPVREGDRGFSRDDIRGKVALVNVWGSWCGACKLEHPYLMQLAASGAPLYGVDWKDDPADGAKTLKMMGDPYLRVGNDQAGRLSLDLGVTGAPETFVIDRQGRIRYKQVGPITPEIWRDTLQPLIARLEAGQ
jgi:cytochrome c biogenesis protein CcmG, thiol:disulfide interchange protein DsbE